MGGQRSEFSEQRDIFLTMFNWEYNELHRPNIFELSSFRSAITVKNLSKYRASLVWMRFVFGVRLKRGRSEGRETGGPGKTFHDCSSRLLENAIFSE